MQEHTMASEFRNEALTDFSKEENAAQMRAAIEKVRGELGRDYPLVIGGERVLTGRTFDSRNPARKTEVVGRFQKANAELARQAIETADETFQTWSRTSAQERTDLLFRVAAMMRERRHELSAWMVFEVAKSWAEADGDTAEAIDFCEFYAREMLRRRRERVDLHPARRRRRHPPLEFPARDHGGHDRRVGRDGQHSRPQAFVRRADHRI
jgi:1-pyrroline-5-carboxylate dehydrogenase